MFKYFHRSRRPNARETLSYAESILISVYVMMHQEDVISFNLGLFVTSTIP
jgi:hypothetical protein